MQQRPPGLARFLVGLLAPGRYRDDLLGDLDEEYDRRREEQGVFFARRWYRRQLLSSDWLALHREAAEIFRLEKVTKENWMSSFFQDVRFALRSLRRTPGFTAVAVITLALGIGANVALMSVVRAVLLRPLPYEDPARVVTIWSRWTGFPKTWVSLEEYRRYREELRSLDRIGIFFTQDVNLTDRDEPARVRSAMVTPSLLRVLGSTPVHGRLFDREDATAGGDVVLLSHRLWQSRYGGEAELIGRRVEVDGTARRVVGVMPSGFQLPLDFNAEAPTEIWFPFDVPDGAVPLPENGGNHGLYVVARLKKAASLDQLRAELLAFNQRDSEDGIYDPEWRFRTLAFLVADDVLGRVRPALWVLLGAVGFVLFIACANVANLVLSKGQERRREIALRTTLGAAASRVFRQLFTESLVLAALAGIVALFVARWAIALLLALEPGSIPRLAETRLDAPLVGFAALVSLVIAIVFGVLPALTASRVNLRTALTDGGRSSSHGIGSQRFRSALVALQVAIAVVLVVGAGLMIRTFSHLLRIDPGFRPENVLTLRLSTPEADYPETPDVIGFYQRLIEGVRALPGVEAAGAVRILPLATQIGDWGTRIEGYQPPPGESIAADWQIATPGYIEAMGIPLLEGRTITDADRADSEPVALVNEAFAKRYWPNDSAIGKRILTRGAEDPPWVRVVGVVGNVRHNGITADTKEKWYRPHAQFHQSSGFAPRAMTLTLRARVPPEALVAPVRDLLRGLDPRLPISEVRSLEEVLASSVAESRFTTSLLVLFSALALLLASLGIYGVVAYLVSQRTREMGIRMAMGAGPGKVLGLVLRQGLSMSGVGVVVGSALAVALTRFMSSLLHGVSALDPFTLMVVPLVLVAAALTGSMVPALAAARIDPVEALRSE